MGADDIREHALTSTPDTLDWDCFTFGIIQKPDHFTFYASVDHLHIDGMSAGIIFLDIHLAYQDLIAGRPVTATEVGGYRGYTARQSEQVAAMDLSSPEIRDWISFAQDTDGDWPSFPLELGDTWSTNKGDFITVELLNGEADRGLRRSMPQRRRTLLRRRHGVRGAGRAPAHRQHHLSRLHPVRHPHAGRRDPERRLVRRPIPCHRADR